MNQHSPHMITLARGLLPLAGLSLLITTGTSDNFLANLENFFYTWPVLVYPVYWFTILFAALLLVFPLTLAQDHIVRLAEGHHDETPASFWIRDLIAELLVGTAVGCLISGLMHATPFYWWIILSALWISYHLVIPRLQSQIIHHEDGHQAESLHELKIELHHILHEHGVDFHDVRPLDEEDHPREAMDIFIVTEENKNLLYVPRQWTRNWSSGEIAALVLHKLWLKESAIFSLNVMLEALLALVCFGGFALLQPIITSSFDLATRHPLSLAPFLIGWLIVSAFLFRIPILAVYRHWIYKADAAVTRQLKSPDTLIASFERAINEIPVMVNYPRWAEILFYSAPSMSRRIAQLKTSL